MEKLNECGREKYWKEMEVEQKLGVLKSVLLVLAESLYIYELNLNKLFEHEHNSKGDLLKKIKKQIYVDGDYDRNPTMLEKIKRMFRDFEK